MNAKFVVLQSEVHMKYANKKKLNNHKRCPSFCGWTISAPQYWCLLRYARPQKKDSNLDTITEDRQKYRFGHMAETNGDPTTQIATVMSVIVVN